VDAMAGGQGAEQDVHHQVARPAFGEVGQAQFA